MTADPSPPSSSPASTESWFSSFVPRQGLKRSYTTYRALARENMAIYLTGKYEHPAGVEVSIAEANAAAAASGATFPPSHVFALPPAGALPGAVEITGETTIGALHRLVAIEGEPNSVGLNFANPEEPGGGFLRGAVAQEEAICRCSTLYDLLLTQPEMYVKVAENDGLYTDYMSLIRDVPIIRDDQYEFLEKPFLASFITCAAPIAFMYQEVSSDERRLYNALEVRIRKIVQCAIVGGFTNVVLGAFGCGAFGNSTENVAAMFKKVLIDENLKSYFRKIVFAIYTPPDSPQTGFFKAAFGQE
jgi:uncharacterized protein (TIGR02452 family)